MQIPEYDEKQAIPQRKEAYKLCYSVDSLDASDEDRRKLKELLLQLYPEHFTYGSPAKEEWHRAFDYLNSFKPNKVRSLFFKPILVN